MKTTAMFASLVLAASLATPSRLRAAGPPERSSAATLASDTSGLTIPAETEASVLLLSGLHTKIAQVNDRVEGQLMRPVYVDGQVALPPGTLLFGRITTVRPAGRLHRPGKVAFRFDEVYLPSGESEPVTARLASLENPGNMRIDREGELKGGRQISWHFLTATLVGAGGLAVIPKVAGATLAASAGSIATAGALGYFVLFPHGPEVHLPPDTRCRVRFDYSFTVHGQS